MTLLILLALQDLSPADAAARMRPADGLEVRCVAHEPAIRQPVAISFDERGRLWVLQYLQYPNPAGLRAVQVDEFLRTVYDRVPEPPPKGPKGADRLTILEDADGDGLYEKAKDFVGGLNLASGFCVGRGGVYVAQPPYLLFYPDRDRDDVPDGDPEVLLSGFGMEDAHAFANSLQWGPDGWLYGAQGSTVTAKIRGVEFQQGLWRFHPVTKDFELFCEGGGNTWGLDFDRRGHAIAGTNFGGKAMLHQVQGAYYVKGFTKHGPLHNPHSYGYFDHVPYKGFKGGHVTCGGVFLGDLYVAANPLSNDLYAHRLTADGSSFKAEPAGDYLVGNDPWFRPVDCLVGPDGALYVADWHDKRLNHVDPRDNWDRSNGRIFRVAPKGLKPAGSFDLSQKNPAELLELLKHPNDWWRREARRQLAERGDRSAVGLLGEAGDLALQALWALAAAGAVDEPLAVRLLDHPNDAVREWAVRLIGDRKATSALPSLVKRCADPSPHVLMQLACTAKRLPDGLAIARELLKRDDLAKDPLIPMLVWWAIEDKALSAAEDVLEILDAPDAWDRPMIRDAVGPRIARRYLAEPDWVLCRRVLDSAPRDRRTPVIRGFNEALEGRLLKAPGNLELQLRILFGRGKNDPEILRLAYRLGLGEARDHAPKLAVDPQAPEPLRLAALELLGLAGPDAVPPLLDALSIGSDKSRLAALGSLQAIADPRVSAALIERLPSLPPALQARARQALLARPATALETLRAVEAGRIPKELLRPEDLRGPAAFGHEPLSALIAKLYGAVGREPAAAKKARVHNSKVAVSRLKGDPARGLPHFQKLCAPCHTIFGQGGKVAPDLTTADRKNLDYLLTNIIDPSALIRPEFAAFQVLTTDGQVLIGIAVEQAPGAVTLVDAQTTRHVIPRDRIQAMKASELSLMPDGLIDPLDDQQTADLVAFLRSDAPSAPAADVLPGTAPLAEKADLSEKMVADLDVFLRKRIADTLDAPPADPAAARKKLAERLGVVDARIERPSFEFMIGVERAAILARGTGFDVLAVRWSVLRGISGEGLLLNPSAAPVANVIALPDADVAPERIAGLLPDTSERMQYARALAEQGCRVLVPTLIDRSDDFSVSRIGRATNQPHREFVYRPAFMFGRTVIGYEVQKVLAAADALQSMKGGAEIPLKVVGWGEGGLVALMAAALDPRIAHAHVSGYIGNRRDSWREPIYRNVFGLLQGLNDRQLVSLAADVFVEDSPGPAVSGPPAPRPGRAGAAPGALLAALRGEPGVAERPAATSTAPKIVAPLPDAKARMKRQLDELLDDTQHLLRESERVRDAFFWKKLDLKSVAGFEKSTEPLREVFHKDVIGRLELPAVPPNPRSRLVYDEPAYRGYEVVLDVAPPEVFAYGLLLVPKDLKPGERRPVVVCQHGLEGRPQDLADPKKSHPAYNQYANRLAERGFVVFAPQNPYLGRDKFRVLQRQANLLGLHLFSIIVEQHRVITDWLAAQPYVDPERIAFYGLSYGGKTAMRVPAVLKRYCLSICSADFNEWIWKNAALDSSYSYVTTGEYEIFEWNLGNTFNYAEMAGLIAPRPFMVERGHDDGVAPDERVAYEFAKVKRLYVKLGIGDRAEIEFFNGPHTIHGVGTFKFLHKHLNWPEPK